MTNQMAPSHSASRASYSAPQLIEYGTLRDVTLAVGGTGKNDNGVKTGQNKTS